jgi:hypothetical protein
MIEETTNEQKEITINNINNHKLTKNDKYIIETVRKTRDGKEYLNEYYNQNKEKIKGQIKEDEKTKHIKLDYYGK